MKKKITVRFSPDLIAEIDRIAGSKASRSVFVEGILREYFKEKTRQAINQRDAEIINANADYFIREMEDVLRYQADPFAEPVLTYEEALKLNMAVVPLSPSDIIR